MGRFWKMVVALGVGVAVCGAMAPAAWAAEKKAPAKAKPAAPVCVAQIYVVKGCAACEAMEQWLKAGGVKLERIDVEQGPHKQYPTVTYSDKSVDHGEKMYKKEVAIPAKICVVSCTFGTE